jgi:DNA-directed RNA polymerase beta' subunit
MNINYRIGKIQFGLLSPEEINRMSVVHVTKPLTYENGRAIQNGLNDPKMGVTEYGELCATCWLGQDRCPGHFGHINLTLPVFNIQFLKGTRMGNSISIKGILSCICIKCGKLLVDVPEIINSIKPKKRVNYIKSLIGSSAKCRSKHGCGTEQPKLDYTTSKYNRITYSYGTGKDKKIEELSVQYVLELFKRIDNKTVKLLGMNPKWARPEWMIFTKLPVPPPSLRPSIKSETAKHEDDLVVAFMDIIKHNTELEKVIDQGNKKTIDTYQNLVNLYINAMISGKGVGNDSLVAFSTGGKPLKSIKDRLWSKDGRMRGNLMGKRVDFSARTVITPEPNISVDQLGVPLEIAMNLTFPEIVTKDNMDMMYKLIYNGPKKHPGANSIKQKNGVERALKYVDIYNLVLEEGDIIERHLMDDDIVLFNRQPSLHKMSMMGHRTVILSGKTFRLNPSACTSYNADFDGDEMNMFPTRSAKTASELKLLALVPTQVISPAKSRSIIGVIQDTLVGAFKCTKENKLIEQKRFFNIMMGNYLFDGNIKIKNTYDGNDIFSSFLPPVNYKKYKTEIVDEHINDINNLINFIKNKGLIEHINDINFLEVSFIKNEVIKLIDNIIKKHSRLLTSNIKDELNTIKNKIIDNKTINIIKNIDTLQNYINLSKPKKDNKIIFEIKQGKLINGIIGKTQLKPGSGGDNNLIYRTWLDYGDESSRNLIDQIQGTINQWLIEEGHTIGAGDMYVKSEDVRNKVYLSILESIKAYKRLEQTVIEQKLIPGIGRSIEDEFEFQSKIIFDNLFSGKLQKLLVDYLKTTENNLFNMIESGSKGSGINITQIMGCVGPQAIDGKRIPKSYGDRTLPHYTKYDNNVEARGFVKNSYITGLSPVEFFFHMVSGREGLIDTAIKTSESGYISRKLMKSMEDLTVHYDCIVRNSIGRVLQFIYGENGMNPIYCEHVLITLIDFDNNQMKQKYKISIKDLEDILDKELYNTLFVKNNDADNNKKLVKSEYLKILYYRKLLRDYIFKFNNSADITFLTPVKITRIIEDSLVELNIDDTFKPLVNPIYIIKKVNGLCKALPLLFEKTNFNINDGIPFNDDLDDELINNLNEDDLLNDKFKLNFNLLFKTIRHKYNRFDIATLLFKIYIKSVLNIKQIIMKYKMTKEVFDYIIDKILYKFSRAIIENGDMVGAIGAQSIGEPTTQATLNSVDYKQKILVGRKINDNNGKITLDIQEVQIGKFVDDTLQYLIDNNHIKNNDPNLQYFNYKNQRPDKAEYGEIRSMNYYTISSNKDGYLRWKELTGVSKHIPINDDGSNKLLKIKLTNGSVIRATAGHSFLVRESNGLVKKEGKLLKVGDYIPVMKDFPMDNINELNYLDITKYFPKNEYIYGTEMIKAKQIMDKYDRLGIRNWFVGNNGNKFTVPYIRSDTVRCALANKPRVRNGKQICKITQTYKYGCIYTKNFGENVIPEEIELDNDFGFFIGIYLAEGNLNGERRNKVMITNNDIRIRDKVEQFVKKFNINCHTQIFKDKIQKGWTSSSITIHSSLLAQLIEKICGVYSDKKFVPSFAYNSNEDFIKGILSGYFSGDGCISNRNYITCTSVSKYLLKGIGLLLLRLGIYYRIITPKRITKNNRGTLEENIKQHYVLTISVSNAIKFINNIEMYKNYNDDRIDKLKIRKSDYKYGLNDYIPNVKIGDKIETIHRDKLYKYVDKYPELQDIIDCNICFEKIVSIEWYNPSTNYTYDITVNYDHTFITNTVLSRQTFHFAGIAAKSSVIGGVPRLKELLRATKKIKTPLTEAFLHPDFANDKYRAKAIANSIEYTTLDIFSKKVDIYYDPDPKNTIISQDKEFVKEYFKYTIDHIDVSKLSKFVLRIELDKRKVIYKQLRMNYIKYIIESYRNKQYYVINTDDNAKKLILHIRVDMTNISNKSTKQQEEIYKAKDTILYEIIIRGIKDINSAQIDNSGEKLINYDINTGKRILNDQWVIYTDGTNLKYILGEPGIDSTRTISNDVYEVFTILGIEAARQLLYNEFKDTFSATGSDLNYHHLGLLVDLMTYYGQLMPISRHGINRTDNSVLAKASFEETLEQLGEASVYGLNDPMTGISSNIMCGQMMPAGTGANFDLIYDIQSNGTTIDELDELFNDE